MLRKNNNQEISAIFEEIASFLEMDGVAFKPRAYRRVAAVLKDLDQDVFIIYNKGGEKALDSIPGVGTAIAAKIIEYIKTGSIKYWKKLQKTRPIALNELLRIEGLGPRRIRILYEKLGIKNLKDLEKAIAKKKIAPLFGFGIKTEENIKQAIIFLKRSRGRFLLGEILPFTKRFLDAIKKLKEVKEIKVAGSIRRRKQTIGDIDFLVISEHPLKVMSFFVNMADVEKVWAHGLSKSSVRMKQGFDVDLRIMSAASYGAALQYFTGSKMHNIKTRRIAIKKGWRLNEYGLFKGKKRIAGHNEKEIYEKLGMRYIEPELREDRGEIQAAFLNKLPVLVSQADIKGDLHSHSNWNGGYNSISEMAEKAISLGYEYLGISDHTETLRIENGLTERQLITQRREINSLNIGFKALGLNFKVLQGCEANILLDGSLDISDKALSNLDYAIAGIHSHMKMSKRDMTKRIIKAIKNPYIRIISHPTGRILKKRKEYEIDFAKILRISLQMKKVLEINSAPRRLDLDDEKIKMAKEAGIKMVINSDAHQKENLSQIKYGIFQARRGWAEKKDIINTRSIDNLFN